MSSKDEVDRPIVALKFKVANHQRTVGLAARLQRQRDGMEDKVMPVPTYTFLGLRHTDCTG